MKLGFIGCGNMAKAMIAGIIAKNVVSPEDIFASNSSAAHAQASADELGIHTTTNNIEVIHNSDVIFLSVKPYQYETIIAEIASSVGNKTIVTVAPGKTLAWLEEKFNTPTKLVRTAPNTPALVGAGITCYCENEHVNAEELAQVESLLSSFGNIVHLPESQLDVACAVGGSGPAFVYMFIEALGDAGVSEGLARNDAYTIAAQMVLGSAKMVLETGKYPGALKDDVCSPKGSTIKGVEALEAKAFRGAVIDAIRTTAAAARNL